MEYTILECKSSLMHIINMKMINKQITVRFLH